MTRIVALAVVLAFMGQDNPWLVFEGGDGPGKGKHIVLISGDQEYRSEEAIPQLATFVSRRFELDFVAICLPRLAEWEIFDAGTLGLQLDGHELTLVPSAVVSSSGAPAEASLWVQGHYWWSSIEATPDSRRIDVEAVSLGDLLERFAPTVVAIDIEGAETRLFPVEVPECVRSVFIEIHSPAIGSAETARVVSSLHASGFELVDIRAWTWVFCRSCVRLEASAVV